MTLRTCGEREGDSLILLDWKNLSVNLFSICGTDSKKRKDFQKQKPFYSEEDDNGFQDEMEVKKSEKR